MVRHIIDELGEDNILLIQHDSYYHDLAHLTFEERTKQNFDHPSALETDLMIRHLKALKNGDEVEIPVYDFTKHIRRDETRLVEPRKIILIDGILIFTEKKLRGLMDIKLYVDTDDDIRLMRRIQRDIVERDRSLEKVLTQYQKFVRPMHLEFVEPTKRYADIIIPHGGENQVALDMVNALIQDHLKDNSIFRR